jgi:metal-responsive CopG/Arc/MetJ family transcriptional regulator
MAARSVQISLDSALLARIDKQPVARRLGRSAFIRAALETYLADERAREIDRAYDLAYGKQGSKSAFEEFGSMSGAQVWPEE